MPRFLRLLNHDFFPGLSDWVRRFVLTPFGCLTAAVVVAVLCGLVVHPRVFALAGGLGVVVAVGVCWPWLTARGVRVDLRFGRERVTEGESVAVTAVVVNHLPWPAWGLAVRGLDRAPHDGPPAARLGGVAGRAETQCEWAFIPTRRGEYPLGLPRMMSGFPFGLWEAGRAVRVGGSLVVWPKTVPVGPVPVSDGDEVVEGNVTRNKVGSIGDVLGVRPYRRGDSPRRIHWPQSARHDRLIVCELQSNSRPVVLVVLDADVGVHTVGPDGSREWAVRVAASLAKGWLEAGAQVGIAWDGVMIPPASGGSQLLRVMDSLARLSDRGQRPLGDVLRLPAVAGQRAGVTVAVTTDTGLAGLGGRCDGVRFVTLACDSFRGSASVAAEPSFGPTCDEGPVRQPPRAWLTIPSADRIPHLLRHGWAEARHGS